MLKRRQRVWLLSIPLSATLFGLVALNSQAQESGKPAASPQAATQEPERAVIGKPFKDFALRDLASDKKATTIKLSDYKGKKAVVAIFMANRCGTTWTYEERIGKLIQDYAKKDVAIVAIHSNYAEPDAEILGQIEQRNLAIPVLDDKPTQALADYVGAQVTPTFLVIDKKGILRYKGAFDKRGDDKVAYVRPALDAVMSGKEVAVTTSRAFG